MWRVSTRTPYVIDGHALYDAIIQARPELGPEETELGRRARVVISHDATQATVLVDGPWSEEAEEEIARLLAEAPPIPQTPLPQPTVKDELRALSDRIDQIEAKLARIETSIGKTGGDKEDDGATTTR